MSTAGLQSKFSFCLMSWMFRVRDLLRPPEKLLQQTPLGPGMKVVDYGCGPGAFSLAAARIVGPEGCVYAVDIHPLAIRSVQRAAARKGLSNIQTLLGSRLAELASHQIDLILCYDVLHLIADIPTMLADMHRVLKANGVLSVSDHHLPDEEILRRITEGGLFSLAVRGRWTFQFVPIAQSSLATGREG